MWYDAGMSTDDDNMRREFESFKEIVEAKMETMEAKDKSAIDRLISSNEKFINTITMRMILVASLGIGILALIFK